MLFYFYSSIFNYIVCSLCFFSEVYADSGDEESDEVNEPEPPKYKGKQKATEPEKENNPNLLDDFNNKVAIRDALLEDYEIASKAWNSSNSATDEEIALSIGQQLDKINDEIERLCHEHDLLDPADINEKEEDN